MNAPEAHYVANADAKVQLFSLMTITFLHFFKSHNLQQHKILVIYIQLRTKSPQTAIFSLFLCNFAVALRLLDHRARINKRKQRYICRIFVTSQSLHT